MHDGDRSNEPATLGAFGYFAAIVLCCIIVGGLTYGLGRENERRYETPASYAKAAKADAETACAGSEKSAAFECIYEKVEAAQEQARGEQDLSAQQKAANSALLSAIIAFFTLILTGVGVWFVKRTLDATLKAVEDTGEATIAMREANNIAREAAQGNRAWVNFDRYEFYFFQDGIDEGGNLVNGVNFRLFWKNTGLSPAVNLAFRWTMAEIGFGDVMPVFDAPDDNQVGPITTVGPGQPACSDELSVLDEQLDRMEAHQSAIVIHIFVRYDDIFGNRRFSQLAARITVNGHTFAEDGSRWPKFFFQLQGPQNTCS